MVSIDPDGWAVYTFDLKPIGERKMSHGFATVDWHRGYAVSASLNVIFFATMWVDLNLPKGEPHQLILIDSFATEKRDHGGSLGATLHPVVGSWLEQKGTAGHLEEPSRVMAEAYKSVTKGYNSDNDEGCFSCTRASLEHPARLTLDVPGQACGLYVDGMFRYKPNGGLPMDCHNVDSPMQQLALLSGLTAVIMEYQRECAGEH